MSAVGRKNQTVFRGFESALTAAIFSRQKTKMQCLWVAALENFLKNLKKNKNVINHDFGCQYNDRVTIFQGSHSDENFMSGILYHAVKSVDIIIHNSEYSLNLDKDTYVLFNRLFKYLLKENGIYFINGYNNYRPNSEIFKKSF